MRRPLPPIHEALEDLQTRLRQCRDGRLKWRLQLLILIQQKEVSSRKEAAQRLAQHRNTIGQWLRCYEAEGLTGLLHLKRAGAPVGGGKLTEALRQALQRRLAEPQGFRSYGEVRQWLYQEFGERFAYSTIYRWVRYQLKAKLKRPRPEHPKKKPPTPPALPNISNAV